MTAALAAFLAAAGVAVVAAAAVTLRVAWRVADRFMVPEPYGLQPEFRVLEVDGDRVALPPPPGPGQFADTRKRGTYGLLWEGGHGRLGDVEHDDGTRVVRPVRTVAGRAPRPGDPARLDSFVFRRDPRSDRGLPFEDVTVRSDAGELAAWWIDRGSPTAVLLLHGRRRGERAETLRALPAVAEGRSALVLAYRNHAGSPPSPDGLYHYGATEARDALATLPFLAARGVSHLVLVGFSTGGTVALEALRRWPPALDGGGPPPSPVGLVLDAPLIDPGTIIGRAVASAGLPLSRATARLALGVAAARSGVRWRALDQRRHAPSIDVPVLLVAGTADATIPIDLVDDFAGRVRAPLEYHRLEGVEHVEAWNADPERYEGWLRSFVERVDPGS